MIAGALIGAGCVLAGFAAGFFVARASASQLVAVPQLGRDDEPAGVFAQSEASEYIREMERAELNGRRSPGTWEDSGVYSHGDE